MGVNGITESRAVLEEVMELLLKWEKHSNTLHILADQIMGLERCEKQKIAVPPDTYTAVRSTIQHKIVEELENLSVFLNELEVQRDTMASHIDSMEAKCHTILEAEQDQSLRPSTEFPLLQTMYSIYNHVHVIVSMKKIPLHNARVDDFQSLQELQQMNLTTESIKTELEKVLHGLVLA